MPGTTPRRPSTTRVTAEEVKANMSERQPYTFDEPADEVAFDAAIAQADKDLGARSEARVNFRWEVAPLDIVRRAASLSGMTYQNWIKHALYQSAIAEIAAARGVDPRAGLPTS